MPVDIKSWRLFYKKCLDDQDVTGTTLFFHSHKGYIFMDLTVADDECAILVVRVAPHGLKESIVDSLTKEFAVNSH